MEGRKNLQVRQVRTYLGTGYEKMLCAKEKGK